MYVVSRFPLRITSVVPLSLSRSSASPWAEVGCSLRLSALLEPKGRQGPPEPNTWAGPAEALKRRSTSAFFCEGERFGPDPCVRRTTSQAAEYGGHRYRRSALANGSNKPEAMCSSCLVLAAVVPSGTGSPASCGARTDFLCTAEIQDGCILEGRQEQEALHSQSSGYRGKLHAKRTRCS